MKKYILRTGCFLITFIFIFYSLQSVLHYRWTGREDLYTRNIDYANAPANSIDVLCFGTSELYAGFSPIVLYHESGITGYNFAISHRSAVTTYYQLLYALKYQTPKIVLCDFSSLYDDQLPSEVEKIYRKVVDTMPDQQIKNSLIKEICQLDSSQKFLSWKFPLFRYHSMWSELTEANFKIDYQYDSKYPQYKKGALLHTSTFSEELFEISPTLWESETDTSPLSPISVKYYDMFIEECQRRGIKVVALLPPKLNDAKQYTARWQSQKEFFSSRNVYCLNYNTYDQFLKLKLDLEHDYYDLGHLNVYGSIKLTTQLGEDLRQKYNFPDKREDPTYETWNEQWKLFKTQVLTKETS